MVSSKKRDSQATLIVQQIAQDPAVELFHTLDGDEYANVVVNAHRETHLIRSLGFRNYLRRLFFRSMRKAPGASVITDATIMCGGLASDPVSPVHPVYLRIGESEDGTLWLDLCDRDWHTVRIRPSGWEVIENAPVRFRRASGAMSLPLPETGGTLDLLRPFLNLTSDDDFCLVLSWLVAALRPRGPFPILGLHGEQGTAKSTLSRILRELIDPYKAPLRTAPRDERDLQIAAANSHVVAYDNISRLEAWLSDGLCRLSTGGGLATRTLYTDAEETVFDAQRPVLLNGISDVGIRGDFAERSIVLYLPHISPDERQQERDLWNAFRAVRPRILGALLDAIAAGLRRMESGFTLSEMPRMADFAVWATAVEEPLGFERGTFLRAYRANQNEATSVVLDDAVAQSILRFAGGCDSWIGTAGELLKLLTVDLPTNDKSFPKNPISFSNLLRRLAPSLRTLGVDLRFGKREPKTGRRLIELSQCVGAETV
jgi:hypothetical protein